MPQQRGQPLLKTDDAPVITKPSRTSLPACWQKSLDSVLISSLVLARRVKALAEKIRDDYRGKNPVIVSVLNGTVIFTSDLIRHLDIPLTLDFVGTSSYRNAKRPGQFRFTKHLAVDITDREVLLVDDILDTGNTLHRLVERLTKHGPRSLRICVLLEKQAPHIHPIHAHYVGFRIPDEFVVGYGLDYAGQYRNLPFIGILRPSHTSLHGRS